jgi:hypothetical protein
MIINNISVAPEEEETRKKIVENMNKLNGANFNIHKMTKAEIAQKFDKHAPHWYIKLISSRLLQILIKLFKKLIIPTQNKEILTLLEKLMGTCNNLTN